MSLPHVPASASLSQSPSYSPAVSPPFPSVSLAASTPSPVASHALPPSSLHPSQVSLAINELKRTATPDGKPTVVFRQGEYVPFLAVQKTGGAAGSKQFENVATPEEVSIYALLHARSMTLPPGLHGTHPSPLQPSHTGDHALHACRPPARLRAADAAGSHWAGPGAEREQR